MLLRASQRHCEDAEDDHLHASSNAYTKRRERALHPLLREAFCSQARAMCGLRSAMIRFLKELQMEVQEVRTITQRVQLCPSLA